MTARTTPPFRADHVGSFLRPQYLLEARDQYFNQKTISAEQLRAVEDRLTVTDVGSSNGSYVRLNGPRVVRNGDFLLLGQQLFRVHVL